MHTRLSEIIKYKTGGKQTEFSDLFDWSPQYLSNLLKGERFGIQPVLAVITRFPDINARWLLTGEGDMIENKKYENIRKNMHENISKLLDIEKYMPVMSPDELRNFERVVTGKQKADFSPDTVAKWETLLQQRNEEINAKFKDANTKSNNLCSRKKVKKQ